MNSKICAKCGIEKEESLFSPSNFHKGGGWCKACYKEYKQQYYLANKERLSEKGKAYYVANKPAITTNHAVYRKANAKAVAEQQRIYNETHKEAVQSRQKKWREDNKDAIAESKSNYYRENKDKIKAIERDRYQREKPRIISRIREYEKNRMLTDPEFRLKKGISRSIRLAIRNPNGKCGKSVLDHLPYSISELKQHLEQQFESWMTWENWGPYNKDLWNNNDQSTWTWQIDHIVPHSAFYYVSMEDQAFKDCWALSNLRSVSSKINIHDSAKGLKRKRRGSK